MTNKSRARLAFVMLATEIEFRSIITLTYPSLYPNSGVRVKRHLNHFLTRLRTSYPHIDYVWIVEFQERGAPHFHIMTTWGDPTNENRYWLAYAWKMIVARWQWRAELRDTGGENTPGMLQKLYRWHCHKRAWEPIRKRDGPRRYMMQYPVKPRQKTVPEEYQNVGRFWGVSNNVIRGIQRSSEWTVSEPELRLALRTLDHPSAQWEVLPGMLFNFDFEDLTENVSRETNLAALNT